MNISIDVISLNFMMNPFQVESRKGDYLIYIGNSNRLFSKNENLNQIIINGVILEENSCNLSNKAK
jgi:hypothetical protein